MPRKPAPQPAPPATPMTDAAPHRNSPDLAASVPATSVHRASVDQKPHAPPAPYLEPAVPVAAILVAGNVRKRFDEDALAELAADIAANGILQPLVVRLNPVLGDQRYVLVAGERRLRAARIAGLETVPCMVHDLDATAAARVQLLENLHRADLDPIEEAEALQALIDQHHYTQRGLGEALGIAQPTVANKLRLLRLPETVRESISRGILAPSTAQALLRYEQRPALVETAAKRLVDQRTSQHDAPRVIGDVVLAQCPRVDASRGRGDATCDPEAHKDCPCRRTVSGAAAWQGGHVAVCIDDARYRQVEAEIQARRKAEAERAAAAGRTAPIDLNMAPWRDYGDGRNYVVVVASDKADHSDCPCRRDALRFGEPCVACVDPKRHDKLERAAAAERNRSVRAAIADENGRILEWAGTPEPDEAALAYVLALLVQCVHPDYGPNGDRRANRADFLREVVHLPPEQAKLGGAALAAALAECPADDLWRAIVAWPCLCEGESPRDMGSAATWYRRTTQGLPMQDRCAVCHEARDLPDLVRLYLWRESRRAYSAGSLGEWVLVCRQCEGRAQDAGFGRGEPPDGDGGRMAEWRAAEILRDSRPDEDDEADEPAEVGRHEDQGQ